MLRNRTKKALTINTHLSELEAKRQDSETHYLVPIVELTEDYALVELYPDTYGIAIFSCADKQRVKALGDQFCVGTPVHVNRKMRADGSFRVKLRIHPNEEETVFHITTRHTQPASAAVTHSAPIRKEAPVTLLKLLKEMNSPQVSPSEVNANDQASSEEPKEVQKTFVLIHQLANLNRNAQLPAQSAHSAALPSESFSPLPQGLTFTSKDSSPHPSITPVRMLQKRSLHLRGVSANLHNLVRSTEMIKPVADAHDILPGRVITPPISNSPAPELLHAAAESVFEPRERIPHWDIRKTQATPSELDAPSSNVDRPNPSSECLEIYLAFKKAVQVENRKLLGECREKNELSKLIEIFNLHQESITSKLTKLIEFADGSATNQAQNIKSCCFFFKCRGSLSQTDEIIQLLSKIDLNNLTQDVVITVKSYLYGIDAEYDDIQPRYAFTNFPDI